MKEIHRQGIHLLAALIAMALVIITGRLTTMALLFAIIIIGSLVINLKMQGKKIPIIDQIIKRYERGNTRFVGYGSAWFAVGCLITIVFLSDINQILSVLWVLGIGDGIATIAGINGKRKLFYNRKKTLEGSIAFFLSSIPVYLLIGPNAFFLALGTAIVESLPIPLDDNATIPIIGAAILSFGL